MASEVTPLAAPRRSFVQRRAAALVAHPNVARAPRTDTSVESPASAPKSGRPLGRLLDAVAERGEVPLTIGVALVAQLLLGLHALHKGREECWLRAERTPAAPDNVLVAADGMVLLLDSNLVSAPRQTTTESETGRIAASFSYLSPEQLTGGNVDRRSDVFSAGVLLYLLSTGRHPFKHAGTPAVIHSIASDEVAPPSSIVPGYPREVERVVMRALEREPSRRFASAAAMQVALLRALPEYAEVGSPPEIAKFFAGFFDRRDPSPESLPEGTPQVATATTSQEQEPAHAERVDTRSTLEPIALQTSAPSARPRVGALTSRSSSLRTFAIACLAMLLGALSGHGFGNGSGAPPHTYAAATEPLAPPAPPAPVGVDTARLVEPILSVDALPLESPQPPTAGGAQATQGEKPHAQRRKPPRQRRSVKWTAKSSARGHAELLKPDWGI